MKDIYSILETLGFNYLEKSLVEPRDAVRDICKRRGLSIKNLNIPECISTFFKCWCN